MALTPEGPGEAGGGGGLVSLSRGSLDRRRSRAGASPAGAGASEAATRGDPGPCGLAEPRHPPGRQSPGQDTQGHTQCPWEAPRAAAGTRGPEQPVTAPHCQHRERVSGPHKGPQPGPHSRGPPVPPSGIRAVSMSAARRMERMPDQPPRPSSPSEHRPPKGHLLGTRTGRPPREEGSGVSSRRVKGSRFD